MTLDIKNIVSTADKKHEENVTTELQNFDYAGVSYSITGIKPFNLCLTNDNNKQLLISGDTSLDVCIPCDRCLTEVTEHFEIHIEHSLKLLDGEVICEDDEEGYDFLTDGVLDVDRLIYDEILVNWPTKVLCKDDCKGLCPVCGQNLNQQDCGCDRQVIDPRMAKFQDIFNEFKEV